MREGDDVDKGEAVYEFIDKFAYFSCAANIILESYTMTDGEAAYKKLMGAFEQYIEYYDILSNRVKKGEISQEVADVSIETYVNWLQGKSIKAFFEKMQICLRDHSEGGINIEDKLENLQTKLRTSKFSTSDLQIFLENIRALEER